MKHFICEIIKPIKRRSSRTALDKSKPMNRIISVHTTPQQCLYQYLRDGKCYNGQSSFACKEFKQQAVGIDLEQVTTELKERIKDSIVLKYQERAEGNRVSVGSGSQENDDNELHLAVIASGGGRVNEKAPKSLCTKCGEWVQYPYDPKTLQVTCWLCVAKEVFECANEKHETPDTKPKEGKSNGKRSSIPRRKKSGRRNSRA